MIFIDSNIPMYLVGAPHPNRDVANSILERCIRAGTRLVTDTEVLQEILHRYVAINRRAAIQPAYDAVLDLVDEVLPVELPDVQRAKEIVLGNRRLSARDALHAAIMERHGVTQIATFDEGFDAVPGLSRVL